MGLEGGEMPGRAEGDLGSMQAICYAAVIANELMRRQEGLEDRDQDDSKLAEQSG